MKVWIYFFSCLFCFLGVTNVLIIFDRKRVSAQPISVNVTMETQVVLFLHSVGGLSTGFALTHFTGQSILFFLQASGVNEEQKHLLPEKYHGTTVLTKAMQHHFRIFDF